MPNGKPVFRFAHADSFSLCLDSLVCGSIRKPILSDTELLIFKFNFFGLYTLCLMRERKVKLALVV